MADGSTKTISTIMTDDVVLGYDAKTKTLLPTRVTRIDTHTGSFTLAGVWLSPVQELTADNRAALTAPTLLEATANHPVLTNKGRKRLGDVKVGEMLYRYEASINTVVAYKVVRTEQSIRSAKTVYNLATESGAYLVGETVVLDK